MKKSQQLIESTGVRTTLKFDNIDSNPSGLKKTMMPWQPEYSSMCLIVFRKEYEIREHSYSQISLLIILILKLWVCSGLVIFFLQIDISYKGNVKGQCLRFSIILGWNDYGKMNMIFSFHLIKRFTLWLWHLLKRSFCIHINIKRAQIVCLYSMNFSEHKIYYNYLAIAAITIY